MLLDTLILASSSPRRQELLTSLGVAFQIDAHPLPEEGCYWDSLPQERARLLARAKAWASARRCGLPALGGDTVVDVAGREFGKPLNEEMAIHMLQELSGRCHAVHSGVALVWPRHRAHVKWPLAPAEQVGQWCVESCDEFDVISITVTTRVTFRELSSAEIRAYIATGEPWDKAGGYAVQGGAALFVAALEGCYTNVVGFPLCAVALLLEALGVEYCRPRPLGQCRMPGDGGCFFAR